MPSRNVKGALAPVKRGHSVAINIAPDECIPSPNNKEYLWDLRDLCDKIISAISAGQQKKALKSV